MHFSSLLAKQGDQTSHILRSRTRITCSSHRENHIFSKLGCTHGNHSEDCLTKALAPEEFRSSKNRIKSLKLCESCVTIAATTRKGTGSHLCQLFAVNGSQSRDYTDELKEFFTHSVEHPHGWGMAMFYEGGSVSLEKEPECAVKSRYLKQRLSQRIVVSSMMAHIRYATVGGMEYSNTHPFIDRDSTGRCWTQIHNGTIFDYPELRPYVSQQDGTTDSERILCYFIDQLNWQSTAFQKPLDSQERFDLLDSIVCEMARGNKLNLILYDGELMYVHTNFRDSLYYCQNNGSTLFCTVPLSKGSWHPVPFTQLLAYKDGYLLYRGTIHGNEYIPNPEQLKYMHSEFANP